MDKTYQLIKFLLGEREEFPYFQDEAPEIPPIWENN